MHVHVAFTPDEAAAAPTGVVIDVIRATSTICQALDAGYERVWCAAEVEDARALGNHDVTLGGERLGVRIDGFDLGNSPREYLEPRTPTLAMSTTNGTRAIVTAAERCDRVYIASLLNLRAVTEQARAANPAICIIARAHSDDEIEHLKKFGADVVIMGEREIARGMVDYIKAHAPVAAASADDLGHA